MTDRIPLKDAVILANEIVQLFQRSTSRIEIAGSIRRQKETVKDAEIIFVPKLTETTAGLFGELGEPRNEQFVTALDLLDQCILNHRRDKNGRQCFGKAFQRVVYKGFAIDLFACLPGMQWGILKFIRTGPADWNKDWVTSRIHGGLMPPGYRQEDWNLVINGRQVLVPFEEDYFRLCRYKFIEPAQRGIAKVERI